MSAPKLDGFIPKTKKQLAVEREAAMRLLEEEGFLVHKPQPALDPVDFDTSRVRGDRVRVGFISDTHIGSKYQQITHLREFMRYAEKEAKVDCFIHGGDVVDGPIEAHRGAIHEMWTGTYDGQRAAAIELLPETKKKVYVIRGNHDEFYLKNAGGDIVGDICAARGFEYVGISTAGALIQFGDVRVLVQHPHDGMSYALSYKLQKRIEALAPENRPHILALGNYHKAAHLPNYRDTDGFLLPAFQSQSAWMASKALASIVGGLILEFGTITKGLAPSLKTEWVLFRDVLADDW
jgi:predicted phosphodiesterase